MKNDDDWIKWSQYVLESIKEIKGDIKWLTRGLILLLLTVVGELIAIILQYLKH